MRIIHRLDEMTETARGWLAAGPVGFIPTSGHLHAGQLSLVQAAQRECEVTVVSIFADPSVPKILPQGAGPIYDLTRDVQLLASAQVDVVFIPRPEEIYPPTFATSITTSGPLTERLEASLSPDYARVLATTFTRLCQLIRPDMVYFGQKSIQQVALVRNLIHDLSIDTSVRVLPMVREGDGLALSCDNALLPPAERKAAPLLYRALLNAKKLFEQGESCPIVLEQSMAEMISASSLLSLEYAAVCDLSTFAELTRLPAPNKTSAGILLAVAACAGSARLTDNIQLTSDGYWLL